MASKMISDFLKEKDGKVPKIVKANIRNEKRSIKSKNKYLLKKHESDFFPEVEKKKKPKKYYYTYIEYSNYIRYFLYKNIGNDWTETRYKLESKIKQDVRKGINYIDFLSKIESDLGMWSNFDYYVDEDGKLKYTDFSV